MKITLQISVFILLIMSCKENVETAKTIERTEILPQKEVKSEEKEKKSKNSVKTDFCWKGKIQGKIPVFVHFQIEDSVVAGEIKYLNTKQQLPIKLIGRQMEGGVLRIQEFEKSGNVSGIITGVIHGDEFKGEWFSPKSRKDLPISMIKYDTVIPSKNLVANYADCYGEYRYQFSKEGSSGGFTLTKRREKTIFDIGCFTAAPAHNMAIIEETEVDLVNNQINYIIPEEETCNFKVKFYNSFAVINYTNGECAMGYFGHNAHVDGVFLKVK
jgi:hypothetical protein